MERSSGRFLAPGTRERVPGEPHAGTRSLVVGDAADRTNGKAAAASSPSGEPAGWSAAAPLPAGGPRSESAEQPPKPLRVLIVDDHAGFAEALVSLLSTDDRIEVVGIGHNGEEALRLADTLAPDIVLMDLDMPVMNGVEATRALVERGRRVLMLTGSESASDIVLARRAGASGLIRKGADSPDVVASLFAIVSKPGA